MTIYSPKSREAAEQTSEGGLCALRSSRPADQNAAHVYEYEYSYGLLRSEPPRSSRHLRLPPSLASDSSSQPYHRFVVSRRTRTAARTLYRRLIARPCPPRPPLPAIPQ
eukprot:scaffold302604_cov25-Prasinocladus_malaysianus.AAC.2